MKFDKNTIFSIVIILLFVGSIGAAGLLYYNPSSKNNSNNNPQPTETKQYTAEEESTVLEIFPNFLVYTIPNIYDQTELENKIRSIEGVETINIEFIEQNEIIALINVKYNTEKQEEIYFALQQLDCFEQIEVFKNGLIETPEEINFSSVDTNETKEYYYPVQKAEGYVLYNTQKEDKIVAQIIGFFQNDVLVHILAQEQQNLSNVQKMFFDQKTYTIDSWNDVYYINAETTIYNSIDVNQIKESFDDDEVDLYVSKQLILSCDKNVLEIKEEILGLKEGKEHVANIVVDENISVSFNQDITLEKYTSLINEVNELLEEEATIVSEPIKIIDIVVSKESIDLEDIENKLTEMNLELINIQRSADVLLDDLFFEEIEYVYDTNITQTNLDYPEDMNKTEILFDVQGITQRNQILYIVLKKAETSEE
jgi:hypothetical protein